MRAPDLSVLIVSYNTRELTLECLASVYAETQGPSFEVVVVDNASRDGSAEAVRERFPDALVEASDTNLGFAAGNQRAAARASGRWLLLLNPDTRVLNGALQKLLAFAEAHPEHGIYGGRTLYGDGTLNPASCWGRITPWSMFCGGSGLTTVFRGSRLFDPESYGAWRRDTVRNVDIVSGCFLLLSRELWDRLDGLDPSFFMYGEEADMCLRAGRLGYRPVVVPSAEIVHYEGRSETVPADKLVRMLAARRMLMERHWSAAWLPFGRCMQKTGVLLRRSVWGAAARLGRESAAHKAGAFRETWARRAEWSRADARSSR
jgi:GT2 family glycosyltransferase